MTSFNLLKGKNIFEYFKSLKCQLNILEKVEMKKNKKNPRHIEYSFKRKHSLSIHQTFKILEDFKKKTRGIDYQACSIIFSQASVTFFTCSIGAISCILLHLLNYCCNQFNSFETET